MLLFLLQNHIQLHRNPFTQYEHLSNLLNIEQTKDSGGHIAFYGVMPTLLLEGVALTI